MTRTKTIQKSASLSTALQSFGEKISTLKGNEGDLNLKDRIEKENDYTESVSNYHKDYMGGYILTSFGCDRVL